MRSSLFFRMYAGGAIAGRMAALHGIRLGRVWAPTVRRTTGSSFFGVVSILSACSLLQYTLMKSGWMSKSTSGPNEEKELEEKYLALQKNLDIVRELEGDPGWDRVEENSTFPSISNKFNALAFTRKVLRGRGRVPAPPEVFMRRDKSESVSVFNVGDDLVGHPGIVHGGFLSTTLDTSMALVAQENLPIKAAYTASLKIDFKKPLPSDRFIVVHSKLGKTERRKAFINSSVTNLDGTEVYCEGTGLFISPPPGLKSLIATKLTAML